MANKFVLSGSPHAHGDLNVKKIMWLVVIALIPTLLTSIFFFGMEALILTLVSVLSCLLFEFLIQKFLLKQAFSLGDGSGMITGLLLAFNLPSNLPLWIVIVGALVAIGVGKMAFGGLGNNPFNPALVGRAFLLISFPVQMTTWPRPWPMAWGERITDVMSGATPLGYAKETLKNGADMESIMSVAANYQDLFLGFRGGSLGEISAIAILLGGVFLLCKKIITWHIPVSFILSAFALAGILWLVDPNSYFNPFFHILSGGLMLGAVFMATDMVTSPMNKWGMIIFGVGCGVITILIRVFGAYPEGVSFAILIMNAFVPLLNKAFKPKVFGHKK